MSDFISNGLILILSTVSGLLLAPAEKTQGKMCQAISMGSPCAQGGTATLGNPKPWLNNGVGNPIDMRSGNKYQRETDLPLQKSGLELVRHYNAMDPRVSALGRGWSWSYDTRVYVTGQQLQVLQADASRLVFNCQGSRCVAATNMHGEIQSHPSGWIWTWPTGKKLQFDLQGRLIELSQPKQPNARKVMIQRFPDGSKRSGLIDQITSGNQQLRFIYDSLSARPKVVAVQTPYGVFNYHYKEADNFAALIKKNTVSGTKNYLLKKMIRPDGMQRIYHYESGLQSGNPFALTGISIANEASEVRTHSWRYDASGRANLFIAGPIFGQGTQTGIPASQTMPELEIERDEAGGIRKLHTNLSAWPGLKFQMDAKGNIASWHMRGIGAETWQRELSESPGSSHAKNSSVRSIRRSFADQSSWQWRMDRHQRVISMHTSKPGTPSVRTRIDWRAKLPVLIEHPQETQILRYARRSSHPSLIREREIFRPGAGGRPPWSYRERFRYNEHAQRIEHVLPEGGSLHYWWSENRLLSIAWQDVKGQRHRIIDSTAGGIRHGNGLVTSARKDQSGLTDLIVYQPIMRSALFHQQIRYNARGAIAAESIYTPGHTTRRSYFRDPFDRLHPATWPMKKTRIQRDVTGLPTRVGELLLEYNALRRLSAVTDLTRSSLSVRYAHNAMGERIWRDDGTHQTHYLFDQNKLVAEARVAGRKTEIVRRYIYAHHVPVAMIENGRDLFMIHTDAVGLPHLMTDAQQRVRWQGRFSAYGELLAEQGDQNMPLRLPGQVVDAATGWHDNYQRTYDPRGGQYLEPDPLGPMPGNSLYGYADQQPRKYADPLGLMLFAFDGTGNQPSSLTNVWLFAKAYRDGPVHYIPGPAGDAGMSATDMKTDMAIAWSGGARVELQWDRLLNAMANLNERNKTVPLDIIGFSRGAALARHFGNRVVEHVKEGRFWAQHPLHGVVSTCVDLRFVGLFDTVAQFNVLGAGNAAFNLELAPAWKWVSHAVALHEHRWLFPLTSAKGPSNVIERAFVGAHADIGGGYLTPEASPGSTSGNLSRVALAWMQWQAEAAGVGLGSKPGAHEVTEPFIHDERAVFSRKMQNSDRRVNHADGRKWVNYQADLPQMGQVLRKEVEAFIRRPPDLSGVGSDVVGLVDMQGYVAWLKDSIGLSW